MTIGTTVGGGSNVGGDPRRGPGRRRRPRLEALETRALLSRVAAGPGPAVHEPTGPAPQVVIERLRPGEALARRERFHHRFRGLPGSVSGVTTNKPWATGITGNTASTAGAFNRNDFRPAIVTIAVTSPGSYALDQGRAGWIQNNTGTAWTRFTLTILPQSTAGASFAGSSDLSGQFPAPTVQARTVVYSHGAVPGPSRYFLPFTDLRAANAGTIVIEETPA